MHSTTEMNEITHTHTNIICIDKKVWTKSDGHLLLLQPQNGTKCVFRFALNNLNDMH